MSVLEWTERVDVITTTVESGIGTAGVGD
ncbi:hypothetical protein A2U01_0112944, partial [Trifolium medium]|nr:hypothetical protein [Trifolium medium]